MELYWKEIIKRSRMLLNWTQEELAEELNVSKRTIEQWEAGNRKPKFITWNAIIEILKKKGLEFNYQHMQISGVKKAKPQPAPEPNPQPAALETPQEQMRQRIKKDGLIGNREPEDFEVELSVIGYMIDDAIRNKDNDILADQVNELERILEKIAEMQFTS